MRIRISLLVLISLLILVGCRQTDTPTAENISVDVALDTENPTVGDATLLVTVTTDDGTAVNDATVTVRGDMTHAGMVPVIPEPVSTANEGVYSIPFEFTMGGDWIITVDVTLANGDTASVDYEVDGVDGADDMDDMDMDDMDMTSAVSGAYMTITNETDNDIVLESISAEGVGMVQLHETTVDDNDMASMQEVDGGIIILAGETVDLMPGGLHVMMMNLENDLVEGETINLTLQFSDGSMVNLDVPIATMPPEESEIISTNNITVTGYWARPTAVDMDMDDSEMEATDEAD